MRTDNLSAKQFCLEIRVRGPYNASFHFESEAQANTWSQADFPELCAKYGPLEASRFPLPSLKVGDTCLVYGEGDRSFRIQDVVQYSPYRYGFLLDAGWTEEVGKCYRE
jgi:hypothetical protein